MASLMEERFNRQMMKLVFMLLTGGFMTDVLLKGYNVTLLNNIKLNILF